MTHGEETFYAVAAQVIPVLFIALAVERQLVRRDMRAPSTHRAFLFELLSFPLTILLMAAGEVAALAAVLEGTTSRLLLLLTSGALLVAASAVLMRAMRGIFEPIEERTRLMRPEWLGEVQIAFLVARLVLIAGVLTILGLVVFD